MLRAVTMAIRTLLTPLSFMKFCRRIESFRRSLPNRPPDIGRFGVLAFVSREGLQSLILRVRRIGAERDGVPVGGDANFVAGILLASHTSRAQLRCGGSRFYRRLHVGDCIGQEEVQLPGGDEEPSERPLVKLPAFMPSRNGRWN
ncbi:hypothetical protein [Bradyrhizobium sp. NBAIM14]|uniref:hypothetical protein n=1 Tax=Bradyrhizobium sp. NBAIM14 TaxID=2793814 RepID=UPI00201C1FD7|nr:hypothetical protein [Bradyrhizobium sp. NBAIM14]